VVEHLLSNCKTLSSNSSNKTKKDKEKKGVGGRRKGWGGEREKCSQITTKTTYETVKLVKINL
jgi:hypothetical protein